MAALGAVLSRAEGRFRPARVTAVDPAASGALTVGVALGFAAGYAFAVARRAWADYRDTRAAIPGLRRTAWRWTGAATARTLAVGVVLVAAMLLAVRGPQ